MGDSGILPPTGESVVLVDQDDRALGTMEKLAAHQQGKLHRALSVVLRSPDGRLLLQRRALGKYHSGGTWTNTCCSHPRPGESPLAASVRRLREEMGIGIATLNPLFTTVYRADVGHGLTEHEFVHVFGGVWNGPILPDPAEVDSHAWIEAEALRRDLDANPDRYSVWFRTYAACFWERIAGPAFAGAN